MWPAPAPATAAAAAAPAATIPPPPGPIINPSPSNSHPSAPDSFLKDGREIRVGESALFQAGNAPPFIGIIRWIRSSEEDYLKLCVNWLYRPADIKLAKGTTLDAAPNEVFYSFHKDVVSAASLLHPCKVAFLRKGVELPRGISSFVCRRVYDIENKRLWWLTDKNYINERQEEVDRLLNRTGLEMHAAVQSGGRSPKRSSNSPSSTQQVKSGSDTVQNSSSSFHSQVKGKKRDRAESGPEPVKRDHSTKPEDVDPSNIKLDNMKAEIGKITEKGGLSNVEAVEKLVNLMLLDRTEKKIDLAGKVMLANVIAATERYDCLGKFVQLMALPVLDDWLQEAHKGKTGDNTSPKEGDKGVEELLLALLRALDKLPVNLNALQTSSVGKSVNNLRSHKNLEIQKKARSLVDTWKKRVDAEMKINDAKSLIAGQAVAWPGKPGFSDVSNSGNRRMGSTDLTTKSSSTQPPPSKALTSKPGHSDSITKSNLLASSSSKLHSSSTIPAAISSTQTTIKEEKSNSSSHSQNNSQSSWKDDARSSTAGSTNVSKASGGSSRHRRSNNGLIGAAVSGAQKESSLGKSASPNRTASLDKALQGGLTCEKPLDTPVGDQGNSHRLIVRLPNPGRSPVRSATGSAFEDPSITGSRMASPGNEHSDQKMKQRGDSSRSQGHTEVNTESSLSRDAKEGPAGSEEAEETGRASDIAKTPLVEPGARNSFSSINALIESCAQYAESSSALIPVGDDGGMNLLASVAAGEISQSSLNTPSGSPGVSPVVEEPCVGDYEVRGILKSEEAAESESGKNEKNGGIMGTDPQQTNLPSQENKTAGPNGQLIVSDSNHDRNTNSFVKTSGKGEEENVTRPGLVNKKCESDGAHNQADKPVVTKHATADPIDRGPSLKIPSTNEGKCADIACDKSGDGEDNAGTSDVVSNSLDNKCDNAAPSSSKIEKLVVEESLSCAKDGVVQKATNSIKQHITSINHADADDRPDNNDTVDTVAVASFRLDKFPSAANANGSHSYRPVSLEESKSVPKNNERKEQAAPVTSNISEQVGGNIGAENKVMESAQESEPCGKPHSAKVSGKNEDGREEAVGPLADASSLGTKPEPDVAAKLDFDLNEGIGGDDAPQCEPATTTSATPLFSTRVHLPGFSPFLSPLPSSGSRAPITVAAPAKGPFVPPENLLKSKGEPGWKGSAATSAFRPAEPRKVLDMPLGTSETVGSDASGKHGRLLLDFDLNVPDEGLLEDMGSQGSAQTTGSASGSVTNLDARTKATGGGLDLDLNRVDEVPDNLQSLAKSNRRLSTAEINGLRDFDLNNGPELNEASAVATPRSQVSKSTTNMSFLSPASAFRMNTDELRNMSSWFPTGNSLPAVAIPSFLPERGEQPYPVVAAPGPQQRILGPVASGGPFGSDIYRGPVLSSSTAMAFPPATAFPYAGFHFSSGFPLVSTSFSAGSTYADSMSVGPSFFPTIPSPFVGPVGVGPAGVGPAHYPRPFMINLAESSNSGGSESSRRWVRQGLDLNAGPGSTDVEGKDGRLAAPLRQIPVATSQAFVEEQGRIYQMSGGGVKRKEPEGGWDAAERSGYKQLSWQ
ncbi:hypothetical protein ACMD2_12187 [Ananas comosus]|uniref:Uncharacterized protein n=1 Tax=Ananas comosus TaxID=4615 RepID=A0A199UPC4_ANACO|nr:hypothetical protein ACMD2_12187 [Ananas comosus]